MWGKSLVTCIGYRSEFTAVASGKYFRRVSCEGAAVMRETKIKAADAATKIVAAGSMSKNRYVRSAPY